jgi:5-hydroxyisourate hydrolase-like protein (transthyretin family)
MRLKIAIALALPLALVVGGASSAAFADDSVTVKGHIRSPTGKPAAGVLVSIYSDTRLDVHDVVKRIRTSATGRYSVAVPADAKRYRLKVTGAGDWAGVPIRTIALTDSSTVVDEVVHHGAKLSGTILDRSGKPAVGVQVRAANVDLKIVSGTTRTAADGTYHLKNLLAGPTTLTVQSPTTNGSERSYSSTSTSGVLAGGTATPIDLAWGKKTTGIGLRFPTVGKITGRITVDGTEPFGEGAAYTTVQLLDATGKQVAQWDAKPVYFFRDLAPGTYFLRFPGDPGGALAEYYRDSPTLADAQAIVIGAKGDAVSGLVANLSTK